ncbi:MAG: hypothetical protein SAK29_27450 [Scytonema sp. PMC 1069.18]|nr:hypothetical protein [Scytonema sp. PMC 1069.18]MEC4885105.1 hypothetical protein [Scytonema sp. PMC 1070.18]
MCGSTGDCLNCRCPPPCPQARLEFSWRTQQFKPGIPPTLILGTGFSLGLLPDLVEAKYEDLTRGFTQLVAELVALDQWEGAPTVSEQPFLVGAITTGTIWQFCRLDRTVKHFEQGINSYRVTEDLEQVMRILVAALNSQ